MPNLLNPADNAQIVQRLKSLRPDAAPLWGKMNVAQVLVHCQQPIKIAFGELKVKRTLLGMIIGGHYKKKFLRDGFSKNLPTQKEFLVAEPSLAFETERDALVRVVERFAKEGASAIIDEPHPFFGKLTKDEWAILQGKHLDHHLKQFGA